MFALQPPAMMSLVVMQLSCSDGGDMLLLTALPRKDALADFDYVTSVDAVTFSESLLPPPFSSSHIVTLLSTNWPGRRQ